MIAEEPLNLNGDTKHDNCKNCSICLEPMEDNDASTTTLECQHTFHSSCLIPWFRRTGACPLCREAADQDERKTFRSMEAMFKLKKSLSRRKDAPKRLKQLVAIHKRKMENVKKAKREYREWKKTEEGKKFTELRKKNLKLQNRTWFYPRFRNRRCVERQIALYPVVPLILPVKRKRSKMSL